MAEYIEREALLKWFEPYLGVGETWVEIHPVLDAIHTLPAADVAPVVRGRWVYDEHEMEYSCSVCLHEAPVGMTTYYTTNYCPYCGARMDGE